MTHDDAVGASVQAPFAHSRRELTRTLRMHQLVTIATLVVCWTISLTFTLGMVSGAIELLKAAGHGSSPSLSTLGIVGLCTAGWLPCCYYLWRCYKSGLRDVRALHRQVCRLDILDADMGKASAPSRRRRPQASPQASPPAETVGFDNVIPFERIRH